MDERVAAHLDGFPVAIPIVVEWADMDVFRHINNAVFFRYFESARIVWLTRIGFGDDDRHGGIGPILHSTRARYRRPLRYPDTAWTGARVTEVLEDRFAMEYRVVSAREGEIAAEGSALVVSYDYSERCKVALPASVRSAINQLRGETYRGSET